MVITSGKAGYFVWKFAGGQGLQEIILSEPSRFFFNSFNWTVSFFSVEKPLDIKIFLNSNVNPIKCRPYFKSKLKINLKEIII